MFSLDQYEAAHSAAAIAERSAHAIVFLTGRDRRAFLQGLLTNDVASLAPGTGTYAAYLTPQGRMICDMQVIETGEQILLAVEPGVAASLAGRLENLIFSEDVQVRSAADALAEVTVIGPSAADVLHTAAGIPATSLATEYASLTSPHVVVADRTYGVPGFNVYVPLADAEKLRARVLASGAVAVSAGTLESLRIEAGRPRFGVDMFTDTIPLEAGIEDRAINFTKGCYVGQEVIVRVKDRGHGRVARRLVRLAVNGRVPGAREPVRSGDQQIGEITSAAESPRAGRPLAFAYLQRDYTSPGTAVSAGSSEAVVYQPVD